NEGLVCALMCIRYLVVRVGGGFGMDYGMVTRPMLNYMVLAHAKGIPGPFPLLFGEVLDPEVQQIEVTTGSETLGRHMATLAGDDSGNTIWFAPLPANVSFPYELTAYNAKGEVVARKSIEGPREDGVLPFAQIP
ncbi:MAG: hypothetical protein K6T85_02960, partial [Gorillibacterium sp.]|nr:hypothetical protein [Gorillibacterium sp.]